MTAIQYDGVLFHATLQNGDVCTLSDSGDYTYSDPTAVQFPRQISVQAALWWQCKREVFLGALVLWLLALAATVINQQVNRRAAHLATRMTTGLTTLAIGALMFGNLGLWAQLVRMGELPALPEFANYTLTASAVILIFTVMLVSVVAGRYTAPLTRMEEQMERLCDGNTATQKTDPGKDELHRIHQTLQELCLSLSIRDYEINCAAQSYGRFVPQGLTKLLNRASISEVSPGDNRRLSGCVGLFSVGNRTEVRSSVSDDGFVEFIEHSLDLLDHSISGNRGHLLSGGLTLSSTEALFSSPTDGVLAGLDLLGAARTPGDGAPAPDPFLLLHSTSFLYGVAGSGEKIYPYLSSAELEFLSGYTSRFYEAGARLVLTDAYRQQLESKQFFLRYIGFLSDTERDSAYKLYEVLDAYPEMECNQRIQCDRQFQEALNLFYHNDFYLARNQFSALLRNCPGDGIARWYLFASEYFFHEGGSGKTDYSLFGINA